MVNFRGQIANLDVNDIRSNAMIARERLIGNVLKYNPIFSLAIVIDLIGICSNIFFEANF